MGIGTGLGCEIEEKNITRGAAREVKGQVKEAAGRAQRKLGEAQRAAHKQAEDETDSLGE